MTERFLDAPIFDADQHMYETAEALTKLPAGRYAPRCNTASSAVRPGSSSTAGCPTSSQPDLRASPRPGARGSSSPGTSNLPRARTLREMQGRAIDSAGGHPHPGGPGQELDRRGVVEAINYPDPASLIEHATADDPELTIAVIHALEPVDGRALELQLPEPGVLHADHQPAPRSTPPSVNWNTCASGAKVALIKPGPVNGLRAMRAQACRSSTVLAGCRSRQFPDRVARHGYPPLDSYVNKWEPLHPELHGDERIPVDGAGATAEIADMLTSLICHGNP